MEKRCSFELFKSNVCHWLKEEGDIDFLIQVLESDLIRKYYLCKEDALPEPHILVIGRWKVEEFLEDKRKQDFRNYLNGVSGNRA